MSEKRRFKMYKHGKLWVTAVAGLGALTMGTMSVDAAETTADNTPVAAQQVTIEQTTDQLSEGVETETVEEAVVAENPAPESTVDADTTTKVEEKKSTEAVVTPKVAENLQATEGTPNKAVETKTEVKPVAPKKVEETPTTKTEVKTTTPKKVEAAPKVKAETKKAAAKKAATKTAVVKTGWQGGKYYKNGKALTGRHTIQGKTYLFGADGKAKKGLQTVGKNKQFYNNNFTQRKNAYVNLGNDGVYYFNANGNAVSGVRKFKDANGKAQVEAYNYATKQQMRNRYFAIDKNTNKPTYYYLGKNGKAITGVRKYTNSKGKIQLEAYNNKTFKQVRNGYFRVDSKSKQPTFYYLGKNGKAITGVRKYKDSKGTLKLEAYNKKTFKQVRNGYFKVNGKNNTKTVHYLNKYGKAVKGARYFGKNVEFYGKDFKRVSNTWKTFNNTRYYFGNNGRASEVLLNYNYYSQLNQGAPQGCEGASMQMALSHKGRHVPSLHTIYKKTGSGYNVSPYNGFFGNPFGNGGAVTETIFASAMANSFKNIGAADLTGAKKNDIIRELNRGNAIVTWADYSWRLSGAHSFHVMTIVGYNNGSFLIADPYAYGHRTLWVGQNTWEYVNSNTQTLGYGAPRSMNMVIR